MSRFRLGFYKGSFGEYGALERGIVVLECKFKVKFLWFETYYWKNIFEVFESDLTDYKNEEQLLEIVINLFLEYRKKTLSERLREKVIKRLN